MNKKEKKVLDLVVALEQHKRWMRKQPWHGRPQQPREKMRATQQILLMNLELADAIKELLGPE